MRSNTTISLRSILAGICVSAVAASALMVPQSNAGMKRNIIKRQSTTTGADDATVLNFALTLEHLENAFYAQGVAKFTEADFESAGFPGVYAHLQKVAEDEQSHVAFLSTALAAAGATPVEACEYNFPYENVSGFLALSQVLEGVGTSAYLGAAGSIENKDFLLAAGSILTVEARHSAFIRLLNSRLPAPAPYDTPQSAAAVVSMATPFFVSCPEGSAPAIMGLPALVIGGDASAVPALGGSLTLAPADAMLADSFPAEVFCGFAAGLGASFTPYTNGTCAIPSDITLGQTYVVLTSGPSVADASVLAGPAIIELGPSDIKVTVA